MKHPLLLSLLASSLLMAGCHTPSPSASAVPTPPSAPVASTASLTGEWNWTCCEGHYHGDLKLQQDGGKLTGRLADENDANGGAIEGTVNGSQVQFARSWGEDFHQDYTLTLSADGNKLEGDLDGTRDESVGAHFEATRK